MHPQLTSLHALFQAEEQPFRKVHRMIDLFESIIKMHTVVIMAEYVRHNRISDTAKGMLAAGLRTPSLGTWQLFSRELFKELQQQGMEWSLPSFAGEFDALDKALKNEKTDVVAFRNGYAHGATPSDAQCTADIRRFEPFLDRLLASEWLRTSSLELRDGRVHLVPPAGGSLALHPLLLHRPEGTDAPYAFFNDLKNDKVGLLNYPLGKHYREKELWHDFHQHLPLHEWKRTGSNEFLQRIEELTETFKGRTLERERLLRFAAGSTSGYLSIQGNPGIGKSALIAQFFKDLRAHEELKGLQVVEYFIRRGTPQARVEYMLEYLIRRTDELFPKGREIRAEGRMTFDLQAQLFSKWRLWGTEGPGRLLFLIDGIDEGVENDLATYLPRELFQHILFIYGSRPGGHASLDRLWGELPVEHHTRLELSGLGREDIRALIYEVANKYELERESAWIEAVQQRSQGNPLYLKLLCDALANGGVPLNDIAALPAGVDDLYRAILLRYADDARDGDALLAALYTFAAAHDFLTLGHLGRINALGEATLQRIGSILKEVLYENPLTEQVLDYQLFHESFREYLRREKPLEVADAAERIMDFCAGWRALEGSWEQRYALEHWAAHLGASRRPERADKLLALMQEKEYMRTQQTVLLSYDATYALLRIGIRTALAKGRMDEALAAGDELVAQHHDEVLNVSGIVELVCAGHLPLALRRIANYGGRDAEGFKQRFILYVLALVQVVLVDQREAAQRRAMAEQLLEQLDAELPADPTLLNWRHMVPLELMLQLAVRLSKLGLDPAILFRRSSIIDQAADLSWCTDAELDVLATAQCATIRHDFDDANVLLGSVVKEWLRRGRTDALEAFAARTGGSMDELIALQPNDHELAVRTELSNEAGRQRMRARIEKAIEEAPTEGEGWLLAMEQCAASAAAAGDLELANELVRKTLAGVTGFEEDWAWRRRDLIRQWAAAHYNAQDISGAMQALLVSAQTIRTRADDWYMANHVMTMASHLQQLGRKDEVLAMLRTMDAPIAERAIENAYVKMISELAQDEDREAVLDAMDALDVRPRFLQLSRLLRIYLQGGRLADARFLLDYILDLTSMFLEEGKVSADLPEALIGHVNALRKAGLLAEAKQVLEIIAEVLDGMEVENEHRHALVAYEWARLGPARTTGELPAFGSSKVYSSQLNAVIATRLAQAGEVMESQRLMKEALALSTRVEDQGQRAILLASLAEEWHVQGAPEKASSCLIEALQYASDASAKDSVKAYEAILKQAGPGVDEPVSAQAMQALISLATTTDPEFLDPSGQVVDVVHALVRQGRWAQAEVLGNALRGWSKHVCFQGNPDFTLEHNGMAAEVRKREGEMKALHAQVNLRSEEARGLYLRGWGDGLWAGAADRDITCAAMPLLFEDADALARLMECHALHQVFAGSATPEQRGRWTDLYQVQWALDLVEQARHSCVTRLANNLEAWLHTVADEDDRAQIELWARQVAKGKLSEEEFAARVAELG